MGYLCGSDKFVYTVRGSYLYKMDIDNGTNNSIASGNDDMTFFADDTGQYIILSEGNNTYKRSTNYGASFNTITASPAFETADCIGKCGNTWVAQYGDKAITATRTVSQVRGFTISDLAAGQRIHPVIATAATGKCLRKAVSVQAWLHRLDYNRQHLEIPGFPLMGTMPFADFGCKTMDLFIPR